MRTDEIGEFLDKLGTYCKKAIEVISLQGSKEEVSYQMKHCLETKQTGQYSDINKVIVATPSRLLDIVPLLNDYDLF